MPIRSSLDGLTPKERKFIEAYTDNATKAAIAAGYSEKTAGRNAGRLMKKEVIRARIEAKQKQDIERLGATREERLGFWRNIMNDPNQKPEVRLKASELLGRANADFVERVESSGRVEIQVVQRFLEPGTQAKQVRDAEVLSIE